MSKCGKDVLLESLLIEIMVNIYHKFSLFPFYLLKKMGYYLIIGAREPCLKFFMILEEA